MESIVYTTGVFDTFHRGHYNFLKKASEYGYLIVGVTSDYLVKKEKNKIPIVNQKNRINTLKRLDFIKEVVLHTNSDKIAVHKIIKFNVFGETFLPSFTMVLANH